MSSTVESIMAAKVVTVAPDAPVADVLNTLYAHRISCVVVCEDDVPVGVISERDIVGYAFKLTSGQADFPLTAGALMSSGVTTVRESASVDEAVDLAEKNRVRRLPVVDADGRLVGILTQTDLIRGLRS